MTTYKLEVTAYEPIYSEDYLDGYSSSMNTKKLLVTILTNTLTGALMQKQFSTQTWKLLFPSSMSIGKLKQL